MSSPMKNRINETIKHLEKALDEWNEISSSHVAIKIPRKKKIVTNKSRQLFRKLKKQINELSG